MKKIFLSKTFDHPTVYNSIGLQSSFIYADTFSGYVRLQIGIGYDPETFLKIRNSNLEKSFSMEIAYLQHTHNEKGICQNEVVASDHKFGIRESNPNFLGFVGKKMRLSSVSFSDYGEAFASQNR